MFLLLFINFYVYITFSLRYKIFKYYYSFTVSAVVTHDNDVTISNTLHTEYLNLPAEEMCQKLKDHVC